MQSVPLSYTPIDIEALSFLLLKYKDKDHTSIVTHFESAIASTLSIPNALCVQSGTAALHLGLRLAGVGPGDLVLTPTFTYIASASPIRYVGATPVFIDCDRETWNIDLDLLEEAIIDLSKKGQRPKALMLVHNYGNPCDMNRVEDIVKKYRLALIEDAAEAIGSTFDGRYAGSSGLAALSFNNNKINTTFGGGVLLTTSSKLHDRAKFLAAHSREDLPYYEHREEGYNYRMGSLVAAYGLSQWEKIKENVAARRATFERYVTAFKEIPGISFQKEVPGAVSNRWLSTFAFGQTAKDRLESELKKNSIETRPLWNPLHSQPLFKDCVHFDRGVARSLFKTGICLPCSTSITRSEQEKVIDVVLQSAQTS